MGGVGSGSWYRYDKKTTLEEVKRVDVRHLKKIGVIGKSRAGKLSWSVNGRPSGAISYEATPEYIDLSFNYRRGPSEDWQPVEQRVYYARTECNYGGIRYWLLCPHCKKRVGILCAADKLFLCRHCYQIPYESQQQGRFDRVITQKHKLGHFIFDDYQGGRGWKKKKGMHWKTFEKLHARYRRLEYQSLIQTEVLLEKLHKRF